MSHKHKFYPVRHPEGYAGLVWICVCRKWYFQPELDEKKEIEVVEKP